MNVCGAERLIRSLSHPRTRENDAGRDVPGAVHAASASAAWGAFWDLSPVRCSAVGLVLVPGDPRRTGGGGMVGTIRAAQQGRGLNGRPWRLLVWPVRLRQADASARRLVARAGGQALRAEPCRAPRVERP